MSLIEESNTNQKIIEEVTRIITLANTVLTTKLPDLTCCSQVQCVQESHECCTASPKPDSLENESDKVIDIKLDESESISKETSFKNAFVLNTSSDSSGEFEGITNKYIEAHDQSLEKYVISASSLICGLEDDFASVNSDTKCERFSSKAAAPSDSKAACTTNKRTDKKISDSQTFVEDESGFSSMTSFQEIGIPIINVIPPTPSKELAFLSQSNNLVHAEETWKSAQIDKQTMKVFWV